ncbi:hypothetical protein [Streptomyces sp. LN245]|uniref:hypothetical protein n=1 Tax=Streptomyces sp. LN245 TaxID=3112975 RepID=UPI00371051E4
MRAPAVYGWAVAHGGIPLARTLPKSSPSLSTASSPGRAIRTTMPSQPVRSSAAHALSASLDKQPDITTTEEGE